MAVWLWCFCGACATQSEAPPICVNVSLASSANKSPCFWIFQNARSLESSADLISRPFCKPVLGLSKGKATSRADFGCGFNLGQAFQCDRISVNKSGAQSVPAVLVVRAKYRHQCINDPKSRQVMVAGFRGEGPKLDSYNPIACLILG